MEQVTMGIATLNKILAYLGTRPYQEVFEHIQAIQSEASASIQRAELETRTLAAKAEEEAKRVGQEISNKLSGYSVDVQPGTAQDVSFTEQPVQDVQPVATDASQDVQSSFTPAVAAAQ